MKPHFLTLTDPAMFPPSDGGLVMPPAFSSLAERHERVGDCYLAECRRRGVHPLVVAWCSPRGLAGPIEAYLFFDYENSPDGQFVTAPDSALLVRLVVDAIECQRGAGRN